MNSLRTFIAVAVLVLVVCALPAEAQVSGIYVERFQSAPDNWVAVPGFPNRLANEPGLPSGSNITIDYVDTPGLYSYRVWAVNWSATDVGVVTFRSTDPFANPSLFIGRGFSTANPSFSLPFPGCRDLGGVRVQGGQPRLQVRTTRHFLGNIDAWEIVRIDSDIGEIRATITHNPVSLGSPLPLGNIVVGSITATGAVVATRGDLNCVTTYGDMAGAVTCDQGEIHEVFVGLNGAGDLTGTVRAKNSGVGLVAVPSGVIGPDALGTPATIEAKSGVDAVQARSIHANITANINQGTGTLGRVESTLGNIIGTVTATSFEDVYSDSSVVVAGDLDADLTATDSVLDRISIAGRLKAGRTIRIGRTLGVSSQLSIGAAQGLNGQVIINAENAGGAWFGTVSVGGVTLSPVPDYAQTAALLGGGAVGYAPFNFHATDCNPAHNAVVPNGMFPSSVRVRHYGPVNSTGTQSPLVIEARATGLGQPYVDITTQFKVTLHAANNLRDIAVEELAGAPIGFAPGYDYRVRPITDTLNPSALRCLLVTGSPVVFRYTYLFSITP